MQAQERELITGLFDRLRPFESQPRDAEAERLIADLVSRQPASSYLLTQTVLVQEEALKAAQARIAELEGKSSGSGFLGSAPNIGPWGAKPATPSSAVPVTASARGPGMFNQQGQGGGGFMRNALATAAGVAGGALLFEGIRNMMGHGQAQAAQPLTEPASDLAPLLPGEQARSADLAQDGGAADDYDAADDSSGFDGGGSDEI
jgi:hypothetical protein